MHPLLLPQSTMQTPQPHPHQTEFKDPIIPVNELVSENAVMVFAKRGCCMCHVVKLLLLGLGVNPAVSDVDDGDVAEVVGRLSEMSGEVVEFPVVFVGGRLVGGLERLMTMYITGELVPVLKEANALWL